MRLHKPVPAGRNVMDLARERVAQAFRQFDTVVVSFSGGKDSTVVLNLALDEARATGKLPLRVSFFDEEAIHPETIEYVERVRARPDVVMDWWCLPIRHRNACSRREPWWNCWDPDKEYLWVRPAPDGAHWTHPAFRKDMSIPDVSPLLYGPEFGQLVQLRGIRAQESIRRQRMMQMKVVDNWIHTAPPFPHVFTADPIYDWKAFDVWVAMRENGWDYARTYDVLEMAGIPTNDQRVCPPFGEEPLLGLRNYAICWPDLWHKMVKRVPGAATAARYARSTMYGTGRLELPPGKTWRGWAFDIVHLYPEPYRSELSGHILSALKYHRSLTSRPIPEKDPDPSSGLSWYFIVRIAMRGDMKGRKMGYLQAQRERAEKRLGISYQERLAMSDEELTALLEGRENAEEGDTRF